MENGFLVLKLSNDSALIAGTGQVAPTRITISLNSSGAIPAATQIYGNDELLPTGTYYFVAVYNATMGPVYGPENFSITGTSPINLNLITPTSGTGLGFSLPGLMGHSFPSSGSFTFTIPPSVSNLKVTIVGGGGGGGGGTGTNAPGMGGGAGGAAIKWLTGMTPGSTLSVTVGAGGAGGNGANGIMGSSSTVASGTQIISSVSASGGNPGQTSAGVPGSGGSTSGADISFPGGWGTETVNAQSTGGGGASSIFGGFGAGAIGNSSGNPGLAAGAGGGGGGGTSGNTTGGAGSIGIVIFEWVA